MRADGGSVVDASMMARSEDCIDVGVRRRVLLGASSSSCLTSTNRIWCCGKVKVGMEE